MLVLLSTFSMLISLVVIDLSIKGLRHLRSERIKIFTSMSVAGIFIYTITSFIFLFIYVLCFYGDESVIFGINIAKFSMVSVFPFILFSTPYLLSIALRYVFKPRDAGFNVPLYIFEILLSIVIIQTVFYANMRFNADMALQ